MMFQAYIKSILQELQETLLKINSGCVEEFVGLLVSSSRIFISGRGRSGFAVNAFAMRLMHLGLESYVVGETITPNITPEDLLVIGSGSGSTDSLVAMAKKAKAIGAKVVLLTILEGSEIAKYADVVITIPAPSPKIKMDTGYATIQPMGSLFEQSLFIVLDTIILLLMEKIHIDSSRMFQRHANLE